VSAPHNKRYGKGREQKKGGDGGGRIIASGSPEEVAKVKGSYTGKYLRATLYQPLIFRPLKNNLIKK